MTQAEIVDVASAEIPSTKQRLFMRYFTAILVDLVVLNLFAQYWERVVIDAFSVSLVAAIVLQVLLKITLNLEHRVAEWFKRRPGVRARVMRFLCAWAILFGSKFVILWVLHFILGDALHFEGPVHGVGALIAVLVAMVLAEEAITRVYRRLA